MKIIFSIFIIAIGAVAAPPSTSIPPQSIISLEGMHGEWRHQHGSIKLKTEGCICEHSIGLRLYLEIIFDDGTGSILHTKSIFKDEVKPLSDFLMKPVDKPAAIGATTASSDGVNVILALTGDDKVIISKASALELGKRIAAISKLIERVTLDGVKSTQTTFP